MGIRPAMPVRKVRAPLAVAVAMALSFQIQAQEAATTPATPATEAAADDEVSELEAIVVTGSRIRRAGFDTLEPATVVSKEYIDARGLTNVADALNEIPGFGAGVTPEGGQSSFGVGVNFVNRFGLGSNRTLTLVNGRRFVSSNASTIFGPAAPGLQVDLNVIPTQMVERVENLAIGGAPTYGSDAIAGTVNLILRRNYEGAEFGTTYGITEQGDNQRMNAYALIGANFGEDDRGNVTFSMSYDNSDGVLQSKRDYFADAFFNTTNPNASLLATTQPGRTPGNDGRFDPSVPFNTSNTDGIPNAVLIRNRRIFSTPPGGLIYPTTGPFRAGTGNLLLNGYGPTFQPYAFDGNGNLVPYNQGNAFSAVDASGGDGLDLVEQGQIISDLERMTVFTTARWRFNDYVEAFFEGSFYTAESTELTDQSIYNSPLFAAASGAIRFPSTYALLTPQAQATLAGFGQTGFFLSRASRDLVENNASGTTDVGRAVVGLEGSFDAANRTFFWEASANYGRSDARFFGTSLIQQNFINALNVTRDAAGNVVCTTTPVAGLVIPGGGAPVADPNCVPLDLFGEGRPSAAARNYVTELTQSQALQEQEVFNVNIASTLVDLWSGPLQYALGYEYRKESGLFDPGPFLAAGLGRAVPITPTRGSFDTNEWFGEFVLPLVNPDSDIPLLDKVDVIGKYRQVDNSINGKFDTYTYGLQYKPYGDLEFRGNFTRSLRSPSITELFTPTASIFTFVNDPCDTRLVAGGARPATRAANCAAFYQFYGLNPASFTSNAVSATVQGVTGGNTGLDNEAADSLTYGFTWSPSFLEGLVVAADYYKIEIDGVIANLGQADIATGCFDNDNFNAADVPNANQFCSRITRDANGQVTSIRTGFVNGEFLNYEGYSAEVRYQLRTDGYGDFNFAWIGNFPKSLEGSNNGVVSDEGVGEIGNSERQYQFNTAWQRENLGLTFSANYLSGAVFDLLNTVESRDILSVDSYWSFNAGASYRFGEKAMLRFAVTNLTDEEPPFPAIGVGTYDLLGRRYAVSFEYKY
ncbi:TonB-dependent receptor domain-containing protein [Cognatilysobacter tabacisoli]|uniref:TonB-dependent receptor domain-containing protein n=1 Tax=Cognatilysobacter tabacisoli TaxID=2315424 RepID=UPI001E61BBC2|nr:TonB-dependent receptor [Lysobacter tabacisoli]